MDVLFLTNLLPYPIDNGGKIKTFTTLKSLNSKCDVLDLVCFTESKSDKVKDPLKLLCSSIHQIPIKLTTTVHMKYMLFLMIVSLFSKYSFGLLKYCSFDMKKTLEQYSKIKKYDIVYFDHLQMCVYYDLVKKLWPNAKIIIDEHNCEYLIIRRMADCCRNTLKKCFLKIETIKLKKFESKIVKLADKLVVLSKKDESDLRKIVTKSIMPNIIPIGLEPASSLHKIKNRNLECINLLYIGTLSWNPNNEGLLWFINNVIPKLVQKNIDFSLTIIGKNPTKHLIESVKELKNVILLGYVENLVPYYLQSDCLIVPLFIGSGQRVKIIEGLSYGIPIISTSIGAEGLELEDGYNAYIADTVESFIEKINKVKIFEIRKMLSKNAIKTFNSLYSIDCVKTRIQELLNC